jgi:putative phage-type endonuclease
MIQQNTAEWLEMRKGKIGSSDAPIIMEISPYKTPYRLWQEKLGIINPEPENFAMSEGKRKEPIARAALELELGIPLIPSIKLHSRISWRMASIDAMSLDERVIAEIKCPGKDDHEMAIAGKVPEKYFPQLQHQLEVCELDMAYYFSFYCEKGVVIKVFRDEKYIKQMLQAEEKFFSFMQNFEAPPLSEKDYQLQVQPEWQHLATKWSKLSSALQRLEEEEEQIRKQLIAMCNGQNSIGSGVKVSKCIRKGAVDYTKVPQLHEVNLEPYRKKTIEYWKILNAN